MIINDVKNLTEAETGTLRALGSKST
jgi:hypothetical protein